MLDIRRLVASPRPPRSNLCRCPRQTGSVALISGYLIMRWLSASEVPLGFVFAVCHRALLARHGVHPPQAPKGSRSGGVHIGASRAASFAFSRAALAVGCLLPRLFVKIGLLGAGASDSRRQWLGLGLFCFLVPLDVLLLRRFSLSISCGWRILARRSDAPQFIRSSCPASLGRSGDPSGHQGSRPCASSIDLFLQLLLRPEHAASWLMALSWRHWLHLGASNGTWPSSQPGLRQGAGSEQ